MNAVSLSSGVARSVGRFSGTPQAASICPAPVQSPTPHLVDDSTQICRENIRSLSRSADVSSFPQSPGHSFCFPDDTQEVPEGVWRIDRSSSDVAKGSVRWHGQSFGDEVDAAVYRLATVTGSFSAGKSRWQRHQMAKAVSVSPHKGGVLVRKPELPSQRGYASSLYSSLSSAGLVSLPSELLSQSTEATAWKIYLDHLGGQQSGAALSDHVRDRAVYLEELGMDTLSAIVKCPSLMEASLSNMKAAVHTLKSDIGLSSSEVCRALQRCPELLAVNSDMSLRPAVRFLTDGVGVDKVNLKKIVSRCPRLLVQPLVSVVQPALDFLSSLGIEELAKVIVNNPSLIAIDPMVKLQPKLAYLESQGLTLDEARSVLSRCPSIFNCSIENNLAPKVMFLTGPMRKSVKELVTFPQFFSFSLEGRIEPRFQSTSSRGLSLGLSSLLTLSDEAFLAKCDKIESKQKPRRPGSAMGY